MTRIVHQPVTVETDSGTGAPARIDGVPVRQVLGYFREWIGILKGEPERDIWRVEMPRGICELHLVKPNHWLLARWED